MSRTASPAPRLGDDLPRIVLVILVACAATVRLYAPTLVRPQLVMDDFQILLRGWTWERTVVELWVPNNEHIMPLGRLLTWAVVGLSGGPAGLPWVAGAVGTLALLAGMVLTYLFVRRELGHPLVGLVAMALFGVSTVFQQAIVWFAASFSVLALDTLLLALLAAQAWRQSGRPLFLILCAAGTALSPTWFASGILAGPLCALYLLIPGERETAAPWSWRGFVRHALAALVPLVGTGLFLAVSLPLSARYIMQLEHYGDRNVVSAFHPTTGFWYTLRSVVENLLLGQVGISSVDVPVWVVLAVWPLLLAATALCLWYVPDGRRLMLLGLGLIFSAYLLVYSARAEWGYEGRMNLPHWSRYHLLPQLGLALFVAGALARWRPSGALSWRQTALLLGLIAILSLVQFPRLLWTQWSEEHVAQVEGLRRIEEVDALCRHHRISAETARTALGVYYVPGSYERENAWDFLRGSPDPDPSITPEEARRLLE